MAAPTTNTSAVAVAVTTPPLAGRGAIVTGASRGMGRAIAAHLASLGARVVINYVSNSTKAELFVADLNSSAENSLPAAISVRADVSDPSGVKSLFDRAEEFFGSKPHILVHCAGVLDPKYPSIATTPLEDWDRTFQINARGSFLCCQEAANRVVRGGGGRIVVLTTTLVETLRPGFGAYTASKAAVEAMVKTMSKELKGTGITANCVAPGAVATEMFYEGKTEEMVRMAVESCAMKRLGETKDVAPVVGFLCGDAAEWVNGQVIRVNGGVL